MNIEYDSNFISLSMMVIIYHCRWVSFCPWSDGITLWRDGIIVERERKVIFFLASDIIFTHFAHKLSYTPSSYFAHELGCHWAPGTYGCEAMLR